MKIIAAANASADSKARANAVCIGQNDDITIQAALRSGDRVQLTEGDFVVGSTINLPSRSMLAGYGMDVTRIVRGSAHRGTIIDAIDAEAVSMEQFTVDDYCSAAYPSSSPGSPMTIRTWQCRSVAIDSVRVRRIWGIGIVIAQSTDVVLTRCHTSDAKGQPKSEGARGGHGIVLTGAYADNGTGPRNLNVKIIGCTSNNNWRTGLYATATDGLVVSGCTFANNAPQEAVNAGIEQGGQIGMCYGCTGATISNNVLSESFYGQGIEIDVSEQGKPSIPISQGITLQGNQISGQGFTGIIVYGDPGATADHARALVTMSGNMLRGNNRRGNAFYGAITVFDGIADFRISDNYISDDMPGCSGIMLRGKNDRFIVSNNSWRTRLPAGSVVPAAIVNGIKPNENGVSPSKVMSGNVSSVEFI